MKNSELVRVMVVGLLLAAPVVNAQEYPAADFQPKVLYRDESIAVPATPAPAAAATAAPCASSAAAVDSSAHSASEVDPNYPAANFQPKVVFFNGSGS